MGAVGGLVGNNWSNVTASYATARVSGATSVGGLVGSSQGAITAGYATGSVSGDSYVGGLVGRHIGGSVIAGYATGSVSGASNVGGLVGESGGNVTSSYWDTETSRQSASAAGTGKTTSELRQPTRYADIYVHWNDLDGDDSVDDTKYWDFGTASQYPALKVDFNGDGRATWEEFGPQAASSIDYDDDDDGLVEVDSLAQLNAMRWDLGGGGASNEAGYLAAYPSSYAVQGRNLGCPSGCVGYELTADLDFDEDGDGTKNDTYNTGSGWQPIGDSSTQFTATFEGNGHVIANLFIDRGSHRSRRAVRVRGFLVGHPQPGAGGCQRLRQRNRVGGLVGRNNGTVTASYATGSVSGQRATSSAGCSGPTAVTSPPATSRAAFPAAATTSAGCSGGT